MKEIMIDSTSKKIALSHLSMGKQLKWKIDNNWYKADAFGYEGLCEVVASQFLKYSNLREDEFVSYYPVVINRDGKKYSGCGSENFIGESQELVTIEQLSRQFTSYGHKAILGKLEKLEDKIICSVDMLERFAGVKDAGAFITKLLELDAFFINEGRTTKDIALLYDLKSKNFEFCPLFDMGASMFSNIMENYPLNMDYDSCCRRVEAKPYSLDFDLQREVAQGLYGSKLRFDMSANDAIKLYNNIVKEQELNSLYPIQIISRVEVTLRMQVQKNAFMFE